MSNSLYSLDFLKFCVKASILIFTFSTIPTQATEKGILEYENTLDYDTAYGVSTVLFICDGNQPITSDEMRINHNVGEKIELDPGTYTWKHISHKVVTGGVNMHKFAGKFCSGVLPVANSGDFLINPGQTTKVKMSAEDGLTFDPNFTYQKMHLIENQPINSTQTGVNVSDVYSTAELLKENFILPYKQICIDGVFTNPSTPPQAGDQYAFYALAPGQYEISIPQWGEEANACDNPMSEISSIEILDQSVTGLVYVPLIPQESVSGVQIEVTYLNDEEELTQTGDSNIITLITGLTLTSLGLFGAYILKLKRNTL